MTVKYPMVSRFADRVAVVTGGAGGMGSAIADRLAAEGATVVLVDRDPRVAAVVEDIAAQDRKAIAIAADLARPEECRRVADEALSRFGRVDVLINNAGINRRGALLDISVDDWDTSFAVNLDSMFHLTRALLGPMIANGGGAIVNTASQAALRPQPGSMAYAVTKAAVLQFSGCLARDYAADNIRVNAVCPGEVKTPMLAEGIRRSGKTWADMDALVPFGRIGTPEEIASLVAFLASDEVPYLCGAAVEIAGAQPTL